MKFIEDSVYFLLEDVFPEAFGVAEDSREPGEMVVEVVLFADVFSESSDDEGKVEAWYFGARDDLVLVEFFAEGDGFFEGDVETHIDAGFLFDVPAVHLN